MQYMKFDKNGNLFLYEPGAGMSGQRKRVIEYGSDDVLYADGTSNKDLEDKKPWNNKFQRMSHDLIHCIIPTKQSVITNATDGKARYLLIFSY